MSVNECMGVLLSISEFKGVILSARLALSDVSVEAFYILCQPKM